MPRPIIDIRNDEALSEALSQVLLFVEEINATASIEVRRLFERRLRGKKEITGGRLTGEDFLPVDFNLKNLILHLFSSKLIGDPWSGRSVLLSLARQIQLQPTIDASVLQALVKLLLHPAQLVPVAGNVTWRTEGPPPLLPRPARIDVLYEHLWLYDSDLGPLVATRHLLDRPSTAIHEIPVYYWTEPFDPIAIVRLFLAEVLGEAGRAADHYLQRWLGEAFHLSIYDKHHKYALAEVCDWFNRLFYGSPNPSTHLVHNHRSPSVSLPLVVAELSQIMRRGEGRGSDHGEEPAQPSVPDLRKAVGFYLFFHFCRQVRRRTFWPDLDRVRKDEFPEKALRDLAAISGKQCVSSLRPLGYTYLQSRIFGVISAIPGLSNVFRGGLLPRTDSGRAIALLGPPGIGKTVFALQLMADFARFGGLAIYLSLEESYDSILDRLVTFSLWDRLKFDVKQAGADLSEVVAERGLSEPEKGLLIFYQPDRSTPSTLPDVITALGKAAQPWSGNRALVVDSVNSLQFPSGSHGEAEPEESRVYIYNTIAQIEKGKFFGVLLAEKDGRFYRMLPYLADTVVELGADEEAHTRWLEIKKCRVQDYHEGKHPFRMVDGRGVAIYPSLASRRSSLRGRVRSTFTRDRVIPYPGAVNFEGIPEKSSTLIWGPQGSGKTLVALKLLTGAACAARLDLGLPQNIMVVSFRSSEKSFVQALENHREVAKNWHPIPQKWLRWYSPGLNLTAEQIVSEIWRYFNDSRRKGLPVDRVVFDETEVAEDVLPSLRRNSLFWPTILELTSTEAATSFFISGSRSDESSVTRLIRGSMDNVLHVFEKAGKDETLRYVELVQQSELLPVSRTIVAEAVAHSTEDLQPGDPPSPGS